MLCFTDKRHIAFPRCVNMFVCLFMSVCQWTFITTTKWIWCENLTTPDIWFQLWKYGYDSAELKKKMINFDTVLGGIRTTYTFLRCWNNMVFFKLLQKRARKTLVKEDQSIFLSREMDLILWDAMLYSFTVWPKW